MERHFDWDEIQIDEEKKALALKQIDIAVNRKKNIFVPSIGRLFMNQMRYVSMQYWILQIGFMVLIMFIMQMLKYLQASETGFLNTMTLMISTIGIIGVGELNRSISCNMTEMEQTCYFCSKQIFCIRMILFGTIDILFLSVLIAMNGMSRGLIFFGLHILVPFVSSNVCYLLIFIVTRGRNPVYTYFLAGVFVGAFSMIAMNLPWVRDTANKGVWLLMLVLSVIGLGLEVRHILKKIEEREVLCMN